MVVQHINDDSAFHQALTSAGQSRLVVCDFFAHWCGPCRAVAPLFENLSNRYTQQAIFLKIDVDRCRATCQQYSIRAMPTFVILQNGEELGRIQGADPGGLEHLIATLVASRAGVVAGISSKPIGEHVANAAERQWLERLVSLAEKMSIYEDPISQTVALSLIPADELRQKATIDGECNDYELAKELLNWFHGFFTWVNQPRCEKCEVDSISEGTSIPSADELQDEADRVELFRCGKCSEQIRFPRYNNPVKLLETRKGRCGEYANCFALCCRAMGFQTRWIMDNLDHVWVEVFSDQLKRWLHCDPCENVIDTPLMYDKGWGKKHAYVVAFAVDHIQDVTWRYHFNHRAVLRRRKEVREPVLRNFIAKLNMRLARQLTDERQADLNQQMIRELVEFLTAHPQLRDGTEAQNHGRRSGAEAWRRARGECK